MSAASPISLADFSILRIRVHWAEAVAIVEELCALLAASGQNGGIPDLRDIAITSHGAVMIRQGAEVSNEIDDIGRTLHALLETDATPMPLRLFVAESIGSGKYTSVAAYAEALSYYARPGRRSLIQALYKRCLEPTDVAQDAPPKPPEAVRPVAKPPQRRRLPVAAVVALAVVLVGAVGAAAWVWRDDPRLAGSVSVVRSAASAAVSAVRQMASAAEPTAVEKADASKQPRSSKAGSRSPRAATASSRAAADLTVDAAALLKSVGVDPAAAAAAPANAGATADVAQALIVDGSAAVPPLLAAPTVGTADSSAVYASGADGVQPPVMYHPKLPPVAPVDPKVGSTNTMELLIDEGGNVEQVKLVSEPVRMSDMLLLSSAKTWRFHPALKDGKPVKFQLSVSWTVSPP